MHIAVSSKVCVSGYGTDAQSDFNEPHAPAIRSDDVQHCTWMFISQKIGNRSAFDMTRLAAASRGICDPDLRWFHRNQEECLRHDAGIYLHWGSAVVCRDTRDPVALADAQNAALTAMQPDLDLLRDNGYAVHLAPRIGVRETRRGLGMHVISENDLRSGLLPDDTVAIGAYCLDIWGGSVSGDAGRQPPYGIPYRALVPRALLFCAQRIEKTNGVSPG